MFKLRSTVQYQILAILGIILVIPLALALTAWSSSGGPGLLDGGGFPTPTETATPTITPTQPLLVFPTATAVGYPPPQGNSLEGGQNQAAPGRQQAQVAQSSPSLALLCVPFGLAAALLIGFVAYRLRRIG